MFIGSVVWRSGSGVRIYSPRNKPKPLAFCHWKRAFWACFRENWVYKFGHWCSWASRIRIHHNLYGSGLKICKVERKLSVPAGGRNRTLTYLDDLPRAKSEDEKLTPREEGIELRPALMTCPVPRVKMKSWPRGRKELNLDLPWWPAPCQEWRWKADPAGGRNWT